LTIAVCRRGLPAGTGNFAGGIDCAAACRWIRPPAGTSTLGAARGMTIRVITKVMIGSRSQTPESTVSRREFVVDATWRGNSRKTLAAI
jgi:hypothetical protein